MHHSYDIRDGGHENMPNALSTCYNKQWLRKGWIATFILSVITFRKIPYPHYVYIKSGKKHYSPSVKLFIFDGKTPNLIVLLTLL